MFTATILVKNETESKQVQDALFKVGFHWGISEKQHFYLDAPFLSVDKHHCITYCDDFKWVIANFKNNTRIPLNAEDVIKDPMCVPGARSPEKMLTIDGKEYSESTIKAALREYVK